MHGEVNLAYPDSHALEIRQTTDKAILHWHEFNIAPGETTRFIHPHDQAITLNRVTSHQSSQILGNLSANGRVILVNPAGIYFGPQAKVNVGSLLATTANIKNEDFLADHYLFEDHPDSIAAVINHGTLTAHDQGLIALVAPTVENRGVIHAHLGKVSLAAGTKFSIDLYGDQLIQFTAGSSASHLIAQHGAIYVDGGTIQISSHLAKEIIDNSINMTGYLQASRVSYSNGHIILESSGESAAPMTVSGEIKAPGGQVHLFNDNAHSPFDFKERTEILPTAKIDVSDPHQAGEILIGGGVQGKGPTTSFTYIAHGAELNADALVKGNGGTIVVWGDNYTQFDGHISAKGGPLGGNGGFVETSGKMGFESIFGQVEAGAPKGLAGSWLLDPANVTISAAATSNGTFSGGSPNTYTTTANTAVANVTTITNSLDAGTDVIINTTPGGTQAGDITVSANIAKTAGTAATLTLNATNSIVINNPISSTSDVLNLVLTAGASSLSFGAAGALTTNNGNGNGNGNVTTTTTAAFRNATLGTGNLTVTSGGAISQVAGTAITGNTLTATTLANAGAAITFGQANNNFTTINLKSRNAANTANAAGALSYTDVNGFDVAALQTTSTTALTAGGNITNSGPIVVGGTTTITALANDVTLNNVGNIFNNIITIPNATNVTLRNTIATSLGTSILSGTLGVTSGGAITQTGPLTVGGTATFAAGATNDITLTDPNNDFNIVNITNGQNVTLVDMNTLTLGPSTVSNNFLINATNLNITGAINNTAGALTLASINGIELLNTVSLTGQGIVINHQINDTLLGTHNLTLNSGGGAVQLAGAIGDVIPPNQLTVNGNGLSLSNGQITTIGTQTFNSPITLQANSTLTSQGDIDFNATINGNYNLTLDAGGDLLFSSTVGGITPLATLFIENANNALTADVNVTNLTLGSQHGGTFTGTINGVGGGAAATLATLYFTAAGIFTMNGCLIPTGCPPIPPTPSGAGGISPAEINYFYIFPAYIELPPPKMECGSEDFKSREGCGDIFNQA